MHQEIFHCQSTSFPNRALGSCQKDVRLPRGAEGAAALLITEGRAGLLQVLTVVGAHLQLSAEVLIHALAKPITRRAAPTVTADESPTGCWGVTRGGSIGASRKEVGVRGCSLNSTVGELAPLTCVDVLVARETQHEMKTLAEPGLLETRTEPETPFTPGNPSSLFLLKMNNWKQRWGRQNFQHSLGKTSHTPFQVMPLQL